MHLIHIYIYIYVNDYILSLHVVIHNIRHPKVTGDEV